MLRGFFISCLVLLSIHTSAQDPEESPAAAHMEAIAAASDQEPENDQAEQNMDYLLRHPLSINRIKPDELLDLQLLSPQQVNAFVQYRNLFGPIRNAYELQAIPLWDITTIRKLLPILSFSETGEESTLVKKIITKGAHQLILRSSKTLERAKGYKSDSIGQKAYAGNSLRLFYRYTYQYKQQAWWGFTGEKDAGEKLGDFTGFHFFIRRNGWLKTIALGDYTVNIGQGLVQWQGLAFGKTSDAMHVFKQGNLVQPYRSAGEFNFNRGIATQFQYKNWELTTFISSKKQTANLVTIGNESGFSSISASGYHRTGAELADRNSLSEKSAGTVLQYQLSRFRIGVSVIAFRFSSMAMPEDKPYNRYAIRGQTWYNSGIQYSYTARNVFLFGELAQCRSGIAILQGMVMSIHHKADLSVVYRKIQPGYQALYARSFTEGSSVSNETGLYTALRLAPWPGWTVQAYLDYFRFPWLRFRADTPGSGQEYFLQLDWVKRKKWAVYLRYRLTDKPENADGEYVHEPILKKQSNIRLHAERIISRRFLFATRFDQVWYKKEGVKQAGTAVYLDTKYHFMKPSLVLAARVQYFSTGGYDSRIYAYERDLLYSFSIPAFYDKGFRYYCQLQGKPARFGKGFHLKLQWWLRWSQTRFSGGHTIGSGQDEISGNKKSEWKMQLMLTW